MGRNEWIKCKYFIWHHTSSKKKQTERICGVKQQYVYSITELLWEYLTKQAQVSQCVKKLRPDFHYISVNTLLWYFSLVVCLVSLSSCEMCAMAQKRLGNTDLEWLKYVCMHASIYAYSFFRYIDRVATFLHSYSSIIVPFLWSKLLLLSVYQ